MLDRVLRPVTHRLSGPVWVCLGSIVFSAALLIAAGDLSAASQSMPFVEDFADTNLRDAGRTTADWSTTEEALVLGGWQNRYGALAPETTTAANITSDAHYSRAVALGDMDGDGDLDLVTGNFGARNRLYLNNGTTDPFAGVAGVDISHHTRNTVAIALGDVDNDGDLDLVTGNDAHIGRLYLNNGTANPFDGVAGSDVDITPIRTSAVSLADVDGDGDLDLVVGLWGVPLSSAPDVVYLNNGTPDPFQNASSRSITAPARTKVMALGDLDNDGDTDLVTGGDSPLRFYLHDGTTQAPWFDAGSPIGQAYQYANVAALGDINGDGLLDLVTSRITTGLMAYFNNGTASPLHDVAGALISSDGTYVRSISLGDVDGDGDLDIVVGNYDKPDQLYLNNGTSDPFAGASGPGISSDMDRTLATTLGDVDGDGDLDLLAGTSQANRLYLNNVTENPFFGDTASEVSSDHLVLAIGDIDGDDDIDLVARGRPYDGATYFLNWLYFNNGTANPFGGVTGVLLNNDNASGATLGDVDGDSDLDLVFGGAGTPGVHAGGLNRLYLNNGTTDPFQGVAGTDITDDVLPTSSVALGDLDDDGDIDLVAASSTNTNVLRSRIYLNNGTAQPFNGVQGLPIHPHQPERTAAIALGDIDDDGDWDLVTGNLGSQPNHLYLNNSTAGSFGGFSRINVPTTGYHNTMALALGDVDGDSDLDLAVGNSTSASKLHLNNGTADPFASSPVMTIFPSIPTNSLALGDINGDGALDVVAGIDNTYDLAAHINNGSADPFANDPEHIDGPEGAFGDNRNVFLADMDGDEQLDLIASFAVKNSYRRRTQLYLNRTPTFPAGFVANPDRFNTAAQVATSLKVDPQELPQVEIVDATLTAVTTLPPNTRVDYYLSNNGGIRYFKVRPGKKFTFPTQGFHLHWRAELHSLSPKYSPRIEEIRIDINSPPALMIRRPLMTPGRRLIPPQN